MVMELSGARMYGRGGGARQQASSGLCGLDYRLCRTRGKLVGVVGCGAGIAIPLDSTEVRAGMARTSQDDT